MPYEQMWFTVLGPVRAWRGPQEIDLGPPQQRTVLALLLAHAGQPVSVSEMVDAMWGPEPPGSAVNAVHRSIGLLRRALEPGLPLRETGRWLSRTGGGYRLDADADAVDLLRFRRLMARARTTSPDDPSARITLFGQALDLWQGPVAAGTELGLREHPVFAALDREYSAAAREAADLALDSGDFVVLPKIVTQ